MVLKIPVKGECNWWTSPKSSSDRYYSLRYLHECQFAGLSVVPILYRCKFVEFFDQAIECKMKMR